MPILNTRQLAIKHAGAEGRLGLYKAYTIRMLVVFRFVYGHLNLKRFLIVCLWILAFAMAANVIT